jgi:hypothetical protein
LVDAALGKQRNAKVDQPWRYVDGEDSDLYFEKRTRFF